ncbi:MAG: cytochrome P460 family protein [Oligoflexales bacterium]
MRMVKFCLALHLFATIAFAAKDGDDPLAIPSLKNLRTMNGISPAPYDEFWNKWRLVTVRYRKDNGEQRFIYANDLAFRAMQEGVENFPDGAVFGKVAFRAKGDPEFPNSLEPSNFTRLQLMVKDSKKFKTTDGWSYWLHVDGATDNPEEDTTNALACHACHTMVKSRDFIFAMPTFQTKLAGWFKEPGNEFKDHFRTRSVAELTAFEKNVLGLISQKPQTLKSYRMRLFSGSLYESIGPLSRFTESGNVYFLVDPVKKKFLIAEPMKPTSECAKLVHIYMDRRMTAKKGDKIDSNITIGKGVVCNGENKWVKSLEAPQWLN